MALLKERQEIIKITELDIGKTVTIAGWVRFARFAGKRVFIKIYDDKKTILSPFQILFEKKQPDDFKDIGIGCSIVVKGQIVKSPKQEQPFEMLAEEYKILGRCERPQDYATLTKSDVSFEYLRQDVKHLETHTVVKSVIYQISHMIVEAFHTFFKERDYTQLKEPLITFSECEGGCQLMSASVLPTKSIKDIPLKKDSDEIDYTKDFFGSKASLTGSSQLELETHLPMGKVYTITTAVRAEDSHTARHLAQFEMLELERPFITGAKDIMIETESLIKFCIDYVLKTCKQEMEYLESKFQKKLVERLVSYLQEPFGIITHADSVEMMLKDETFQFETKPSFEEDLSSEHEHYILGKFKCPVFVTKYPAKVKSFYMPVVEETPEESRGVQHVDCFDLLVPDVGELVGGSARIHSLEEMERRITELGLDRKPLEFYIDLRRQGSIPHGGMGLGVSRLVKLITGCESVKDCVPFPIYAGCAKE
jgi:asparaginyl-tRNA synthetase